MSANPNQTSPAENKVQHLSSQGQVLGFRQQTDRHEWNQPGDFFKKFSLFENLPAGQTSAGTIFRPKS